MVKDIKRKCEGDANGQLIERIEIIQLLRQPSKDQNPIWDAVTTIVTV